MSYFVKSNNKPGIKLNIACLISIEMWNMSQEEPLSCPICTEIIKSIPHVTPCRHAFCVGCFQKWVEVRRGEGANVECPMCRFVLMERISGVPRESWYSIDEEEDTDEEDTPIVLYSVPVIFYLPVVEEDEFYVYEDEDAEEEEEDDDDGDINSKDDWEYDDI